MLITFALLICFAGTLGGVGNVPISDNGFLVPNKETGLGGQVIRRPDILGNTLIGPVSGLLFRLLNTGFAAVPRHFDFINTIAGSIGGTLLAGVGGARIVTGEIDKRFYQSAASAMAKAKPSTKAAKQLASAGPAQAPQIARHLTRG